MPEDPRWNDIFAAYMDSARIAAQLLIPMREVPRQGSLPAGEQHVMERRAALVRNAGMGEARRKELLHLSAFERVQGNPLPPLDEFPPAGQAYVREGYEGFGGALERIVHAFPVDERSAVRDRFRDLDVMDGFAAPYLYLLSPNRIEIPASFLHGQAAQGSTAVVLPLRHEVESLGDGASLAIARTLGKDYLRKMSSEARPILEFWKLWERHRRKMGRVDPQRWAITDEHAVEYAAWRFLQMRPDALVLVGALASRLDDVLPPVPSFPREQLTFAERKMSEFRRRFLDPDSIGCRERVLREGVSVFRISPSQKVRRSIVELFDAGTVHSPGEGSLPLEWFDRPIARLAISAKLYRDRFVKPLTDPEHKEGLLFKDAGGEYLALERALNKDAGRIYQLAYLVQLPLRKTFGGRRFDPKAGAGTVLNMVPMAQGARVVVGKAVEALADTEMLRSLYQRITLASEDPNCVVRPNRLGALFYDHRFIFGLYVGRKLLRNLGDRNRQGQLKTLVEKVGEVIQSGNPLELVGFLKDMLTYDPSEAHRKLGGKIDADMLPATRATVDYFRAYAHGTVDPRVLDDRAIGLRSALATEMLQYPDNILTRFAAGLYWMQQGHLERAREHLLDVDGWLSDDRTPELLEDLASDEQRFLVKQFHAAALYYLSRVEHHRGREEIGMKHLLRAYEIDHKERGRTAPVVDLRSRAIAPSDNIDDLLGSVLLSPFNFAKRLALIETVAEVYGPRAAELHALGFHHDAAMLGAALLPEDGRYVVRLDDFAQRQGDAVLKKPDYLIDPDPSPVAVEKP